MPNLPEDENENRDEDIIEKEIENFLVPEMQKIFKKHVTTYKQNRDRDFKPLMSIAKFLAEHGELSGTIEENRNSILIAWDPICAIIAKDDFYRTKPLSTISKQIQELINFALHGKSNGKTQYATPERGKDLDGLLNKRYSNG